MHSFVKSSFIALTLGQRYHGVVACEGACITDTTKAFISNYSTYHIDPIFNHLSEMIHSKILYHRPISEVRALVVPISAHWHQTIYAQTEKAIFPDYFHGKCQRVIDGVYKHPVGCPNPDCPVVCGTPGSMVHFYDKLVSIVFNVMGKSLHTSLPTNGKAYDRLEQAVMSLASTIKRRSSLIARSNVAADSDRDEDTMAASNDQMESFPPQPSSSLDEGKPPASSFLLMRKNEDGKLEPMHWERSSLALDVPHQPANLRGSTSEPATGALLDNPVTLLREGSTHVLVRSTLPIDPNHLPASLITTESLPDVPTSLLSRGILPVNPAKALESLLLNPAERDSVPQAHRSVTGQDHLPAGASKVHPMQSLRRRNLAANPSVPNRLPIDQDSKDARFKEVLSKLEKVEQEDLPVTSSIDRLLTVRSESSRTSLRFRRVLRPSVSGDESLINEDSDDSEPGDMKMVNEPTSGDDTNEDQGEPPVPDTDNLNQYTRRLFRRQPGFDLPKLTGLDRLAVPVASKRRLVSMSDVQISTFLKQIIKSCNHQLTASCGSKLKNCRWDKSMKPFILSFP